MFRLISVCAGVALATSAASAEFLGVEVRTNAAWNTAANNAIGAGDHAVVRLYAVYDTPESLLNVGQINDDAGFGLADDSSSFFQAMGGGSTAPNSGLFGIAPALQWDTFVSINRLTNDFGDATSLDGSFAFLDTDGDPGHDFVRGGWFNSQPLNGQGGTQFNANTGLQEVFLGQFTIRDHAGSTAGAGPAMTVMNNFFEGELSVFTQMPGGGIVQNAVTFIAVPAPGAATLLGALGLAAVRRRRAA